MLVNEYRLNTNTNIKLTKLNHFIGDMPVLLKRHVVELLSHILLLKTLHFVLICDYMLLYICIILYYTFVL